MGGQRMEWHSELGMLMNHETLGLDPELCSQWIGLIISTYIYIYYIICVYVYIYRERESCIHRYATQQISGGILEFPLKKTWLSGFLGGVQVGFAGSLVGLSDDLLGILDISLEKLPLNTKISGHSAATTQKWQIFSL